jgi:hypothetical protein
VRNQNKTDRFSDPWQFLSTAVWTKDEASGEVKQFPTNVMHDGELRFGYLKYLTEIRLNHQIFAVEKARRMMITWWMLCLYLHEIMTRDNIAAAIVSKKEQDSAYLCGPYRMQFVYDHIPADVWPDKPTVKFSAKNGDGWTLVECPDTGSTIRAVASGPDQLRQFTFTRILLDEFAFHDRARDEWTACKPCIEGGGHIDMVSTPELGAYMYDLLYPAK